MQCLTSLNADMQRWVGNKEINSSCKTRKDIFETFCKIFPRSLSSQCHYEVFFSFSKPIVMSNQRATRGVERSSDHGSHTCHEDKHCVLRNHSKSIYEKEMLGRKSTAHSRLVLSSGLKFLQMGKFTQSPDLAQKRVPFTRVPRERLYRPNIAVIVSYFQGPVAQKLVQIFQAVIDSDSGLSYRCTHLCWPLISMAAAEC